MLDNKNHKSSQKPPTPTPPVESPPAGTGLFDFYQARYFSSQADLNSLSIAHKAMGERYKQALTTHDKAVAHYDELLRNHQTMQKKSEEEAEKAKSARRQTLEEKRKISEEQIQLRQRITHLEVEVEELKLVRELHEKDEAATRKRDGHEADAAAVEKAAVEAQLTALRQAKVTWDKEKAGLQRQVEELQREAAAKATVEAQLTTLQQEKMDWDEEKASLQGKIEELQREAKKADSKDDETLHFVTAVNDRLVETIHTANLLAHLLHDTSAQWQAYITQGGEFNFNSERCNMLLRDYAAQRKPKQPQLAEETKYHLAELGNGEGDEENADDHGDQL